MKADRQKCRAAAYNLQYICDRGALRYGATLRNIPTVVEQPEGRQQGRRRHEQHLVGDGSARQQQQVGPNGDAHELHGRRIRQHEPVRQAGGGREAGGKYGTPLVRAWKGTLDMARLATQAGAVQHQGVTLQVSLAAHEDQQLPLPLPKQRSGQETPVSVAHAPL